MFENFKKVLALKLRDFYYNIHRMEKLIIPNSENTPASKRNEIIIDKIKNYYNLNEAFLKYDDLGSMCIEYHGRMILAIDIKNNEYFATQNVKEAILNSYL